jgi:ElaB/YqjD/DUF883 family membrane-anchored ribosome-binding protein
MKEGRMSGQTGDGGSTVEETAAQAKDMVSQQATQAKERGRGLVEEQLDQRAQQLGQQLDTASSAFRRAAEQARTEGNQSQARMADQIADRAEGIGNHLLQTDGRRLLEEAEDVARRRPWLVAGVGAMIGFALARALKASSGDRYHSRYQTVYSAQASRAGQVSPPPSMTDEDLALSAQDAPTVIVGTTP